MSALLSIVPWWGRITAIAALVAAVFGYGWVKGAEHGQARIDSMLRHAAIEGVRIVTLRGAVTTQVETKYLPQIVREHVITETIVHEVPVYVATTDPDLSPGFRVLHDAAAAGRVPDPAAIPHAAAVPAQAAASSIAANYGACREDQLKLQGLQEWVTKQGGVK